MFSPPVPELSIISNHLMNCIYNRYNYLLSSFNIPLLAANKLEEYANAIHEKGAALDNCWGFVDGTVRPICRPNENQRVLYNGHKKVHSIKFQSVVSPNGMVANMFGPMEGRRHDCALLAASDLLTKLSQHSFAPNGQALSIYGDPAYPLRVHLQSPFKGARLTNDQKRFNKSMSTVRVSVEWIFGDISGYFAFLNYQKNLKIGLSAVGKMYLTCALMHNARTCIYGNITSSFFEVDPPSLEEYFV